MNRQRRVVFFTGAGISAPSGIPTFRSGEAALWNNVPVEKVCYIENFASNYALVHDFYNEMRVKLAEYAPNRAHEAIAELQKAYGTNRVIVVTANVDNLHERAGAEVLHIHGDLQWMREVESGERFHIGYEPFDYDPEQISHKLDVIFFGEQAPAYAPMQALIDSLYHDDLVVIVGSSQQVVPFAMMVGMSSGEQVPVINVDPNHEPSRFIEEGIKLSADIAFAQEGELMARLNDWLKVA